MCMNPRTLRTNIELDLDLVAEASRLTGIRTKRLLVRQGLQALIEARRRRPLSELKGKIRFGASYDYKTARERLG